MFNAMGFITSLHNPQSLHGKKTEKEKQKNCFSIVKNIFSQRTSVDARLLELLLWYA